MLIVIHFVVCSSKILFVLCPRLSDVDQVEEVVISRGVKSTMISDRGAKVIKLLC